MSLVPDISRTGFELGHSRTELTALNQKYEILASKVLSELNELTASITYTHKKYVLEKKYGGLIKMMCPDGQLKNKRMKH